MSTDQMSTCVALLLTCFTSFTSDVFAFVFNTFSFVNFRWTFASDECRNITNSLFHGQPLAAWMFGSYNCIDIVLTLDAVIEAGE